MNYEGELKRIILSDSWMISMLEIVKQLLLPDCWIGAGFVRNKIWDELHQQERTPLNDIDVIYFDQLNLSKNYDPELEQQLKLKVPGFNWSVKNQARMHLKHKHKPYSNCEEAISYWPETATAIAIQLTEKNELDYIAPYGLEDLFQLNLKHSPMSNYEAFQERLLKKNWTERWERLDITV